MSNEYDPNLEVNPNKVLIGGFVLFVLGCATVVFIVFGG